ncbi:tetratricopeptide repeat protein [Anaerolineae bacterium CFX9]|nr:tetratricopeptide repeat protein [Anaerolineae bacterium CFX9]
MRTRRALLIVRLAAAALLSACSVVSVQVEEPIPTVYPIETPVSLPPIQAESSAGLVAREAPDDSDVLVKTVALPHIVYAPDELALEMFGQWSPPVEYLVIDQGHGLRLRINWSALWLTDSYGTGRISMDVSLRSPGESEFQFAQSASTPQFEAWGADYRDELLDSTLYLPDIGTYSIRAEVAVAISSDTGGSMADEYTYEFDVITLNAPQNLIMSAADFAPQFGDLENQYVFLDWRGWRLGPCLIRVEGLPAAASAVSDACVGFANGSRDAAAEAMMAAIQLPDAPPALRSRLYQQLGTLAAVSGDWNKAISHFEPGVQAAIALNDGLEVAIALRNLGVAQMINGQFDSAENNLWQSIQLSDQIEDWLGSTLAYGQFGVYWESLGTLDWVIPVMRENGLSSQAGALERWRSTYLTEALPIE